MRSAIIAMACTIVVVAGSSACGTSCTMEARTSVLVTVKDTAGNVVGDAQVTYHVDAGVEQQAQCPGSTASSCARWTLGYEDAGTFVVVAKSADGTKQAEKSVVVVKDACHVQTEEVTLVLQ
ncbi:MAG: hypothetical protein HY901_16100 [Deltaproteobacteria bacterium]|nr:hypothetical protein [Deltaproteobacteria bacterium]